VAISDSASFLSSVNLVLQLECLTRQESEKIYWRKRFASHTLQDDLWEWFALHAPILTRGDLTEVELYIYAGSILVKRFDSALLPAGTSNMVYSIPCGCD
jgi:hypothetical protein